MNALPVALKGYGIACGLFLGLIALWVACIAASIALSRRRAARCVRRITRGAVR